MHKRFIVSATSDLITDQRVDRSACAIKDMGHEVLVVGRKLRSSPHMVGRRYRTVRFKLWFEKGPLFYATYNLRLLFFLLRNKVDVLFSNDLDTLPANYLASKLKRIPLVYDSHEYYTGVPELEGRPIVKGIWSWFEKRIIPNLHYAITVNNSIANIYSKKYGVKFTVVRNLPILDLEERIEKTALRHELNLPLDKKIVILQGAGINIQRGAEEAVEAMQFTEGVLLLIVGSGDVLPILKKMVAMLNLEGKVKFQPRQPAKLLRKYTQAADLGLSLDKDTNMNYRYSLPNKIFDYIQAGIPVLASDLPEVKKIIEGYGVGSISPSHDPKVLAHCMIDLLQQTDDPNLKERIEKAAYELHWGNEQHYLIELLKKIGN